MAQKQLAFFLAENFRHVRLVEVPDEIVQLITQGDDLLFKSSPPLSSSSIEKGGQLHLCTNDRSWFVKQVSTSNSLYISQAQIPSQPLNGVENKTYRNDAIMTDLEEDTNVTVKSPSLPGCITAISKPTSILELLPISATAQQLTIHEHLAQLVPRLDPLTSDSPAPPSSLYTCTGLLHNAIPAATNAIRQTLAQHCIGDHWEHRAYWPTPRLLLETWKAILTSAITRGVDVQDALSETQLLTDDYEAEAQSIFHSVASLWTVPDGFFAASGLLSVTQDASVRLKAQDTARWVGNLILQVARDESVNGLDTTTFEAQWEDAVPAAWLKFCSVEVLLPACAVETNQDGDGDIVRWMPFLTTTGDGDSVFARTRIQSEKAGAVASGKEREATTAAKTGSSASISKNKRKWHEKFAAQRDAKK